MRICVIGLLLRGDRTRVQKMLHGFTYSLLEVTRKRLETIAEERRDYPSIVPPDYHFDGFTTFDIWLAGLQAKRSGRLKVEICNTTIHFWSVHSLLT
jgi:hypothetical protein